jgi:hypothetical protein
MAVKLAGVEVLARPAKESANLLVLWILGKLIEELLILKRAAGVLWRARAFALVDERTVAAMSWHRLGLFNTVIV